MKRVTGERVTLQDWGAIGELIGGIAVIVTLVYLAIQIREYRLGMSSATFHSTMQGFNQLNAMLGANPDLAEVLERGGRDPGSLDSREQFQFVWLQRSYVNIYENLYQQFLRGACPESYWMRYARELKQTLETPGGRLFRELNSTYDDLYTYLDDMPDNGAPAYAWTITTSEEASEEGAGGNP
jgi:hypothetical protein